MTMVPPRVRILTLAALTLFTACSRSSRATPDVDKIAPRLTAMFPAADATDVALDTEIVATFDEAMLPSSFDSTTFFVSDGLGNLVAGSVTCDGNVATMQPTSPLLPATLYIAAVSSLVQDLAHNPMQVAATWSFTTIAADTTPPQIVQVDPPGNATGVATGIAPSVQFNEPIDPATATAASFVLVAGASSPIVGSVTASGAIATFTPAAPLTAGILHTATITTAITDVAGNALAAAFTWSFFVGTPPGGTLDPGFGTGGVVRESPSTSNDWVTAVLVQPSGRILAGGVTNSGLGAALFGYAADGSRDAAFGSGGGLATAVFVQGLANDTNGRFVTAGGLYVGTLRFAVSRHEANGDLDPSFGIGGIATTPIAGNDLAHAVAIQADGRIVAAGVVAAGASGAVVRFLANGALDTAFGTAGIAALPGAVRAMAVQTDGRIVAAGAQGSAPRHFWLARLGVSGQPDASFGSGGFVTTVASGSPSRNDEIHGIVVQPDGRIVVAGSAESGFGTHDFALARYDTAGALDATFGDGGLRLVDTGSSAEIARDLVLAADGRIVVAGSRAGTGVDFVVLRLDATGSLDASFGSGGAAIFDLGTPFDEGLALARQPDGKLLVGGLTLGTSGYDFAILRCWP